MFSIRQTYFIHKGSTEAPTRNAWPPWSLDHITSALLSVTHLTTLSLIVIIFTYRYPCLNPCLTATMGKVRVNFSFLSLVSLYYYIQYYYYYGGWPFTPRSLITSQQIKILIWNFQDMFLRVKEPNFLTHFPLRYQHEIFRVCSLG